jgi:hypothetical protein
MIRRDLPPQAPPPTLSLPTYPKTPELVIPSAYNRPSSPSNSDSTSISYPATPAGSIRESTILPPHVAFDPRSSGNSGHNPGLGLGLPPLPEDPRGQGQDKRGGKWLDPSTLEAAGLITPPSRNDMSNRAPPQSLSSYQAQAISALQIQNVIHPNQQQIQHHTLTRSTSMISHADQQQYNQQHQHHQSTQSIASNVDPQDLLRHSMFIHPNTPTSPVEQHSKTTLHGSMNGSIDFGREMQGSMHGTFDIDLGSQSSLAGYQNQNRMRSGSMRIKGGEGSFVDTMSIDSGSTGTSDKRAIKLEKQASVLRSANPDSKSSLIFV